MKYLSGQKLVEIYNIFGLSRKYGNESSWVVFGWYLDELLEYVIASNRCDELLRYLFSLIEISLGIF